MVIKCVIVIRNDLNMRKGKMIAQGGHAIQYIMQEYIRYLTGLWSPEIDHRISEIESWMNDYDSRKIVVQATLAEIQEIISKCYDAPITQVIDKGYTDVPSNTLTCIALGPTEGDIIDKYTGGLKLL